MKYTRGSNEVYHIGLSAGAIAVYGYLLHIGNRRTYKSYVSYKTIGKAVKMSANTVRKWSWKHDTSYALRQPVSSRKTGASATVHCCTTYALYKKR